MKKLLYLSILSIFFGGFIYIAFRSENIILFKWINSIYLIDPVQDLRKITLPYKDNLYNWFLYSLPDGLFIFSYTCAMLVIWERKFTKKSTLWILTLPLISILIEILQYNNYIIGTFDIFDIIFYIFGLIIPILINLIINKNETSI